VCNNSNSSEEIITVRCVKCNRILTDPKSIAKKIGPVCERKEEAKATALYMSPKDIRAKEAVLISFWDPSNREVQ